jgi:hypothetical protein
LDGHTCSTKHGRSAKNVWVFGDDAHEGIVSRTIGETGRIIPE